MSTVGSGHANRYQAWIARRPALVLAAAALCAATFVALASRLELRTSFSELLPSDDPGVVALRRTQERMGDLSLLLIGVHSPDKAANIRYADLLTHKLRALPREVCALAAYDVRDVRDFFERHKWLYLGEQDLEDIRDRLRTEIGKRKNPLVVDLGGDDESVDDMRKRLAGKERLGGRFPDGVFSNGAGDYVWIAALPPGGLFAERAGEGLFRAAHQIVKANPPAAFHPAMHVQVSGPVATAIASRQAVERDIVWVTVSCLSLVALSIGLYFGRWRAVPLIGIPAVIGTAAAFAAASLLFGYLNSSTAFLGSIILGNGINYAIVVMSRYEEHRSRGETLKQAMARALSGTWRGTGVAALSASAAYASLTITSFRGFYQFGVMGAVGALSCWIATFTVLPALLVVLDRGRADGRRVRAPLRLRALGSLLDRRPQALLGLSLALTVGGIWGMGHFLKDPFEYDFRKLNAKLRTSAEAKQFDRNMDELFGRWPSPTIVLADRLEEVEAIRAAIRRQDDAHGGSKVVNGPNGPFLRKNVIGQIATIYDLLPGTPAVQERKLALIKRIRKLVKDPALDVLSDEEKKDLAKIDPPEELRVLLPEDVPPLAQRPFTEVDGTIGRVVLVYPIERGLSVWKGEDLLEIASVLQRIDLGHGRLIETSGSAVVFGAMIRSILHDGPIATVASLLVVVLIIATTMRPVRAAGLALVTLLAGVVWMVGAAGVAGVHVTFLNFIALPITFGIGAEYALNVVARYQEDGDIKHAVISTGGAVALCSWTTVVGYGSLLAARNQALQGFGAMAILGEVACLAGAIVALPAALLSVRGRRDG